MRYFLLDKVVEVVPGKRARGVKAVTLTDEVLHDHFPDHPIMPGMLILEAAAQLGGFLLETSLTAPGERPRRALLAQVRNAKFHETCGPGDRLEITTTLGSFQDPAAQVSVEVEAEGKRVARAELTFVMKDIESERVHEQRRYLYKLWTKDLPSPCLIP